MAKEIWAMMTVVLMNALKAVELAFFGLGWERRGEGVRAGTSCGADAYNTN